MECKQNSKSAILLEKAFLGLLAIAGAIISLAVLVPFVFAGIITFQMRTQNLSQDPKFREIYRHSFEVQKDLFILQWSDSKQLYFGTWESSEAVAKVEKGTKLRVKKITLRDNPFAGKSLQVLVEVQDPKFPKNYSKKINAKSLIIDSWSVAYEDSIALFDPEYLRKYPQTTSGNGI